MSRFYSKTKRGLYAIVLLALMVASVTTVTFADDPVTAERAAAPSLPSLSALCDRTLSAIKDREAVQMLTAVLGGSEMGPGDGWFHPSLTRYDWKWLADRHQIAADGAIPADKFQGEEDSFARLDRNRDGEIKADDFDWSNESPYVRQLSQSSSWFRRIDASSNGRLTREEWDKYFERMAKSKEFITPEDLRAALFPAPPAGAANDGPSMPTLVKGLFEGELGSLLEGPALNSRAPDFELKTQDGKKSIRLSSFREKKPVVLIFGSFT